MKELQVGKAKDFKGESLLPTVRYRGRRNKKKKELEGERAGVEEGGTEG